MRTVELTLLSDVSFFRIHGYSVQRAFNYVKAIIAATNIMYERDIRARVVLRYFAVYSQYVFHFKVYIMKLTLSETLLRGIWILWEDICRVGLHCRRLPTWQ